MEDKMHHNKSTHMILRRIIIWVGGALFIWFVLMRVSSYFGICSDSLSVVFACIGLIINANSIKEAAYRYEEERQRDRESYKISQLQLLESFYFNYSNKIDYIYSRDNDLDKTSEISSKISFYLDNIYFNWPYMEANFPKDFHSFVLNLQLASRSHGQYVGLLDSWCQLVSTIVPSDEEQYIRRLIYSLPKNLRPFILCQYLLYAEMSKNTRLNDFVKVDLMRCSDSLEVDKDAVNIFLYLSEKVNVFEPEFYEDQIKSIQDYVNDSVKEKKESDKKFDETLKEACERILENIADDITDNHSFDSYITTSNDATSSISSLN